MPRADGSVRHRHRPRPRPPASSTGCTGLTASFARPIAFRGAGGTCHLTLSLIRKISAYDCMARRSTVYTTDSGSPGKQFGRAQKFIQDFQSGQVLSSFPYANSHHRRLGEDSLDSGAAGMS